MAIIPLLPPIGEHAGEPVVRLDLAIPLENALRARGVPLVYRTIAEADAMLRGLEGITLWIEGENVMQDHIPIVGGDGRFGGFTEEPGAVGSVITSLDESRLQCHCPGVCQLGKMIVRMPVMEGRPEHGTQEYGVHARPDRFYIDRPGCVQGFRPGPWSHLLAFEYPSEPENTPIADRVPGGSLVRGDVMHITRV